MSIGPVRQGTVSQDIKNLAAALMARDRQPIQLLQQRKSTLTQRASVLGALKTRLTALQSAADALGQTGTLSPFAAKSTTSSQNALISAAATSSAATGAMSIAVQQLARRATHVSDLFTDTSTAISGAGAGTFAFTVTVGATNYDVSVTVATGEDDKTVLDNIAAAVATAVGSKGSAMRIQTEAGKSRLSLASGDTGTANKLTFTDTGGLLARIGLYKASPTQATDTTGGYVYEDLGGHQLDAKLLVDGLTYYRASNTISDLVNGVTLSLKGVTTTNADVRIQADGDAMVGRLKEFITKYNDVLDYLSQNTFVDPKAGTRGVLALEPVYGDLAGQLRIRLASRVTSQAAGKPDTLSALGIKPGPDGKLSIVNETALRDTLAADPAAATTLFSAADGLATLLEPYIQSFSKTAGQIASSQNQINLRVSSLDKQIGRMEALVSKRQANLEEQLARNQAIIQGLQRQQQFVQQILGAGL